jgi:hypothetical protein
MRPMSLPVLVAIMFRDAFSPGLTFRQRLGYLFAPPGWSHDGLRETSESLEATYVLRNRAKPASPGLPAMRLRDPASNWTQ